MFGFGLIWFYGISTIIRLLNAIPFLYIYIKYIWSVNAFLLYSHDHDQLYKHIIQIHLPMHAEHNDTMKTTSNTVLRKIYLSLYLKGCVWEGVRDRTELQHIDPHSIGHNRVSFPFSWAAQPEAWRPTLLAFSTASCHQRVWSPK